ncbi:two pore domain potassium channel family protein [Vibrio alginolyticus]|nr:two pore domain potassium channel family protein [Vibrio alginolyticus]
MRPWYNAALESLRQSLKENKKIRGLEFLEEFVDNHREQFFENLELSELDEFASEEFDAFQSWLKESDGGRSSVVVGKNGRWSTIDGVQKESPQKELEIAFQLTKQEQELLDEKALSLHASKVEEFRKLYSKLSATKYQDMIYTCALRLAKCAELSREISEKELIDFWHIAAKEAIKNERPIDACECKYREAYHYQRISDHEKAAECYELAYDLVEEANYDKKSQCLKNARLQYQQYDDQISAEKVFHREKQLEYKEADKVHKLALGLYKVSSNYGESPKKVLKNCFYILLISTIITMMLGITATSEIKNMDLSSYGLIDLVFCLFTYFVDSAYFSVVTFTTLGYGDYSPESSIGKIFSSLLALLGLVYTSLFMVTVVRKYSRT